MEARDFEQVIMPHLDAAYNLAYWMTRSRADAQDVVQEACLRAFKYFDGFTGENPSAWLLSIVRRACYTWLRRNRRPQEEIGLDDEHRDEGPDAAPLMMGAHGMARDPETLLVDARQRRTLHELIAALPPEQREVIVLREIEDLSYREIAAIADIPIGTVMSRLARARALLQSRWRAREEH